MRTPAEGAVYLAPFHVLEPSEFREPARRTETHDAFRAAVVRGEWPYDPSEDPSFFCFRRYRNDGGALTWGICRPNLREQLRVEDVVAFFPVSSRRKDAEYRFAGWATVAEKVSQDQIWTEDRLAVYRDYLNLLVEPLGGGEYIHRENHPHDPHEDWLYRLVARRGYKWKRGDFKPWFDKTYTKTIRPGVDEGAGRQPIRFARNYVIFRSEAPATVILREPPLVATSPGGREPETWLETAFATRLRATCLDKGPRTLRTTAPRNQHPYVRVAADAASWRDSVVPLIRDAGLAAL